MKTIIFFVSTIMCISSEAQTIGKWNVAKNLNDAQIAKTVNDSGSVAGILCIPSKNECSAYLILDTPCEENARYPLMVNSKVGSNIIHTTCIVVDKVQYLIMDEFEAAITAFESGSEFGFALPLLNGRFKVFRFESAGATAAIREARTPPPKSPAPATTTNQTL